MQIRINRCSHDRGKKQQRTLNHPRSMGMGRRKGTRGARRGTAAACLHSTAGTTYPPSVGGRGAALPLKPHYLHDHRGCPRSQPNLRDRNSSHEIGAILIAYEDLGYVPHNLTVGFNRDSIQESIDALSLIFCLEFNSNKSLSPLVSGN